MDVLRIFTIIKKPCHFFNSPGSVVRSHKNFGVEPKIELNYLEGLLLRKKTWVDIPDRLQFSLSSIFSKWLICAMGLWSVKNQCYQIWTYYIPLVRKFDVDQFFQKKCNLKLCIFQANLKHTCWAFSISIYAYLFEVQECKYCLSESLWTLTIY